MSSFEHLLKLAQENPNDEKVLYLLHRHLDRRVVCSQFEARPYIPIHPITQELANQKFIDLLPPYPIRRFELNSVSRKIENRHKNPYFTENYQFSLWSKTRRDQMEEKILKTSVFSNELPLLLSIDLETGNVSFSQGDLTFPSETFTSIEDWAEMFKTCILKREDLAAERIW